jgi:hypothetical protein
VSALALTATLVVLGALALAGFGPALLTRLRERRPRRVHEPPPPAWDPGRELRAERRARELMRSVVSAEDFAMYAELGFIAVEGRPDGGAGYGYLLYPHRPIVAYDTSSGELLNEYCVAFPDRSDPALGARLPDADDVLAKWMSLHGGERELIGVANMHLPGWHVDPGQVHRDLRRLAQWRHARVEAVS